MAGRVYVEQFGGWWSFSKEGWLRFIDRVLEGWDEELDCANYELPDPEETNWAATVAGGRPLRTKPSVVTRQVRGEYGNRNWCVAPPHRVAFPLDRSRYEWERERDHLRERLGSVDE